MSFLINGKSLHAHPPVTSITVNKFNVVFQDAQSKRKVQFDNAKQTRNFVDWLLDSAAVDK